ncbi:hypothetical protein CYMTET_56741 [Cymbomonas tetramitiformis]|uniref:Uncharacterized protein n=1 Tax=Cymbomonas tetramitiformis TaxID=36881 RepID=A0AAE0BAR2_9CHLO|nr:hypothetical protein CYMTET_56741 [Cymbomonas tetramitiformis]
MASEPTSKRHASKGCGLRAARCAQHAEEDPRQSWESTSQRTARRGGPEAIVGVDLTAHSTPRRTRGNRGSRPHSAQHAEEDPRQSWESTSQRTARRGGPEAIVGVDLTAHNCAEKGPEGNRGSRPLAPDMPREDPRQSWKSTSQRTAHAEKDQAIVGVDLWRTACREDQAIGFDRPHSAQHAEKGPGNRGESTSGATACQETTRQSWSILTPHNMREGPEACRGVRPLAQHAEEDPRQSWEIDLTAHSMPRERTGMWDGPPQRTACRGGPEAIVESASQRLAVPRRTRGNH